MDTGERESEQYGDDDTNGGELDRWSGSCGRSVLGMVTIVWTAPPFFLAGFF
jgi:hypothetical protein